jgi:hypothetical protein
MLSATQTVPASRMSLWAGRILSGLVVAFLLLDAVTKIIKAPQVKEAFARLGYPARLAPVIGTVLLVSVAFYAVPRTSILGAILLTGYLGGATKLNLRVGNPLFQTLFPAIFGALVWLGPFLRDDRLCALIPLRTSEADL